MDSTPYYSKQPMVFDIAPALNRHTLQLIYQQKEADLKSFLQMNQQENALDKMLQETREQQNIE